MGQILKFPVQASKFGYKRVRKTAAKAENPNQLDLFAQPTAQILNFVPPDWSRFEQALFLDEHGDPKAAELYSKAIDEHDCVDDAYCNLGIIESKRGNTTKAFDCFSTCLKSNPRHFEAHYNLGNLYFDVSDSRLAQVHYEMALEIDPSFPNAYFNLALALATNQELASAVAALTRYQELVPGPEGRIADELLSNLRKSLAAAKKSHLG
jgi:tetratricopeptide (TPR) repeat protein